MGNPRCGIMGHGAVQVDNGINVSEKTAASVFTVILIRRLASCSVASDSALTSLDPEDEGSMFLRNVKTTRCYNPQNHNLHNHHRENLKLAHGDISSCPVIN
jgi:hypothetical protein